MAGESRAAGGETAGGRESWPAGRLLGIILNYFFTRLHKTKAAGGGDGENDKAKKEKRMAGGDGEEKEREALVWEKGEWRGGGIRKRERGKKMGASWF